MDKSTRCGRMRLPLTFQPRPTTKFFRGSYGFLIPGGLPPSWYKKMRELEQGLALNQRQVLILGLACLCEMGREDPAKVGEMAAAVRERYKRMKKKEEKG